MKNLKLVSREILKIVILFLLSIPVFWGLLILFFPSALFWDVYDYPIGLSWFWEVVIRNPYMAGFTLLVVFAYGYSNKTNQVSSFPFNKKTLLHVVIMLTIVLLLVWGNLYVGSSLFHR
jgi:hypothetical protein